MSYYPDRNPNPVFTLGRDEELVYLNDAAQRILELCGSGSEKVLYPRGFTRCAILSIENKVIHKKAFRVKNRHFSFSFCPREDEDLVDIYGTDISEEIKHQNYFSVISAFTTALLEAETENGVAERITGEAIARLSFVDCVVYLVDRQDGMLKQRAAHGAKNPKSLTNSVLNPLSLSFGEGIAGMAASQKKTIIVEDVTKESRYVLDDEQRLSEIAVPLIAGEEVIGVIDSEHPEKNYFTAEDAKILEAIASIAATRIQHMRSVKESELTQAKFQSFVENAFGGLYIHRDKKFEYVNEQFCEMTGYSFKEMLHDEFDFQSLIVSADEKAIRAMQARHRGDRSPKSYQLEMITKKGEIRQLAINTCILEDERGEVTIGIALDMTETIQSRHQLEEVIATLAKKSEELNEFAHLASHNLRAPVTNLIGLLNHYNQAEPTDPTNQIIVDKFSKTVTQLNLTLEEMHQVLRVRAKDSFEFRAVDLNDVVKGVELQLSEKIRTSGFRIETSFEIENINYEKSHLENLFLNLISNAIKYRREGVDPIIQIQSSKSKEHVRLIFKDNGLGIDLKKHGKNIFGMYKRFHSNPEGRGVGLYLVKKQLNALGSSISIESEPNQGTCFTVFLVSK